MASPDEKVEKRDKISLKIKVRTKNNIYCPIFGGSACHCETPKQHIPRVRNGCQGKNVLSHDIRYVCTVSEFRGMQIFSVVYASYFSEISIGSNDKLF